MERKQTVPDLGVADLTVDYSGPAGDQAAADSRARQLYTEHGCFLAKGLLDEVALEPSRRVIRKLIALRLYALGLPEECADGQSPCFDNGFLRLTALDDGNRVVIASALMRSMALQQLGWDPRLVRLSRLLMATDVIMASDLGGLQIHLPNDRRNLRPWHQDYPYVRDSEDALIYWFPLRSLAGQNGGLRVAPGSHRLGVLPMRGYRPRLPGSERPMRIADLSGLERFPQLTVPVEAGDVLVFSTLLLHASALNRSERVRWTVQVRHGNFEDPRALAWDWPATRLATRFGPFEKTHPEYYLETLEDQDAPE
jgi:Phytanoyl-CoA dioxygenase (PhyH)